MARTLMTESGVRQVQRRTVALLSAAQVFGGIGTGATVSIGSILAVELSGSSVWAGAVATVMTLGAALAALPLASLADRRGRRIGQVTGLSAALAGTVLIVLSVVSGVFVLLVLGAVGIGVGTAASLQARFAAVDLADDEHRGRALSAVVWAVTVGAVAGPNLIQPGTVVGQALGLPPVAGPFVISAAGLLLAIVLLFAGLRPDPLLFARELAARNSPPRTGVTGSPTSRRTRWTATPPAAANEQGTSPRTPAGGSLRPRAAGRPPVQAGGAGAGRRRRSPRSDGGRDVHDAAASAGAGGRTRCSHAGHAATGDVLVIIGFHHLPAHRGDVCAVACHGLADGQGGQDRDHHDRLRYADRSCRRRRVRPASTVAVAVGLVLLGVGWSAATISGSTLLAESVGQESRVVVQGVSDTLMGAAGAVGGATSGLILSWAGYLGLNMAGGLVGAVVLAAAFVTLMARRRSSAAGSVGSSVGS